MARAALVIGGMLLGSQACVGNIGGDDPPPIGQDELACKGGAQDPGPYLITRLTVAEYARTIADTLGVDVGDLLGALPVEQPHDGFVNDPVVQITELDHIVAWNAIAKDVVGRIADFAAFVDEHTSCTIFEASCVEGFVDSVGLRLFRRPVDDVMRDSLAPIFDDVAADGGSFEDAAKIALRAMLQSPWFLYRVEAQLPAEDDGFRRLDDYEIANRLSYLFWGTAPDDELMAKAAAGELTGDDVLAAQIDRLLASPRARDIARVYLGAWLLFDRLKNLPSGLEAEMRAETEAVFDEVVWERDQPLTDLFDADFTIVSEALATHYQLPDPQPGVHRYDLGGVPHRRGILTHGSVLSAGGVDGSYTHRGKFVLNHMLCTDVPPPPPGVNDTPPPTEPGKSQRYYSEQRIATDPCGNCHGYMEPLAWPFSVFGGDGDPISEDRDGNALQTDGRFVTPWNPDGAPFADAEELIALLQAEDRLGECMLIKLAQFSLGREVEDADACTLDAVKKETGQALTYANALRALAMQPSFRMIRGEEE